MRLVIVKHVTVKMRKRMRDGADPRSGSTERMRNRYGDKMRAGTDMGIKCVVLMSFFAPFLRFCVFDLLFFLMDATSY